jgi:hypothetical protein
MPPKRASRQSTGPGGIRRYVLLELPAWLLVGVSVAYAIVSLGGGFAAFFQASLLVAAVAWLVGGRLANFSWGSLLLGWGLGTMAVFNLLVAGNGGLGVAAMLAPVTGYLAVVLVLLEMTGTTRSRLAAGGGVILAPVLQLIALSVLSRT